MVAEQNKRASDRMKARRAATKRKCIICDADTEHKKVKYCATHRGLAADERKAMREKKAGEDWRAVLSEMESEWGEAAHRAVMNS